MIPYEVDPSLHTAEPEPAVLDDGFSPPHAAQPDPPAQIAPAAADAAPGCRLPDKSAF